MKCAFYQITSGSGKSFGFNILFIFCRSLNTCFMAAIERFTLEYLNSSAALIGVKFLRNLVLSVSIKLRSLYKINHNL